MKIAFFEIEQWEADYVKEKLPASDTNIRIHANDTNKSVGLLMEFTEKKLNKDNLPQNKDADIISVFVGSEITKEVINAFPNLKFIATRSTGFDHIDLEAAKQKGIKIGYVPAYGYNTVAEFAFALILNLSRKIFEAYNRIKEKGQFDFEGLRGFDLNKKTIGIVGVGRIGKYMVKIANGFGMNVLACDPFPDKNLAMEIGFQYVSLDDLLANSDVISLHIPCNELTHHLINNQNIGKIKKGALLINTARGPLVETEALVRALNDGILGGYGADVLEEEGVIKDERQFLLNRGLEGRNLRAVLADHVLIDMPNVVITPHNAFNTQEALQRILDADIANIKSFMEKGEAKFPIP